MSGPGYVHVAKAFRAEGVEQVFALIGDANMHWVSEMGRDEGVRVVHALHEHAAVAMAEGYARASGRIGVASVTSGPGFTQIMTALVAAVRGPTPLVVLVGDTPSNAGWALQQIDQGPLAAACGAHYIAVRHVDRLLDAVRDAFYVARTEKRPVVLSIPVDIQKAASPWGFDYRPSTEYAPRVQHMPAAPDMVDELVQLLAAARRPIFLAGRGALRSGAGPHIEKLAEACGGLLGTTLLAKGLFDSSPFSLGIAGAFAPAAVRELYAEADLVVAIGASLGTYTTEAGYLFPNAKVVQLDHSPRGLFQGQRTADLHVRAGASTGVKQVLAALAAQRRSPAAGWRTGEVAARLAQAAAHPDPRPYEPRSGLLDPRAAMLELDRVVPKDWDVVVGGGHYFGIALTHLRGREAARYQVINEFGVIGSTLSAAIGVACARKSRNVMVIEGDGSLMLHVQELDTLRRHGIGLLVCVVNDGGYGAEFHKLRAEGADDIQAVHGRRDFAALARGFGLGGATITETGRLDTLFAQHLEGPGASVWDFHVDDAIPSAAYRRVHYGEAEP